MEPVVHIHLGPGRLGLGLVALTGLDAGFELHLVARPETELPEACSFEVVVATAEGATESRAVAPVALSRADQLSALAPGTAEALTSAHDVLTTAVLTAGITQCSPLIVEMAEARATVAGGSTTFIACENDPGTVFPSLVRALEERGVDCRPTMVNRLCFLHKKEQRDGVRVVRADSLAEWVIGGRATGRALESLDQIEYVRFEDSAEPAKIRKRWLVNGGHLALAILAYRANQPSMDVAVVADGRRRWLAALHAELIAAVEMELGPDASNAEYAAKHVEAWARHEDDVLRVLIRLKRVNLLPLFTDFNRKIGEPARRYVETFGTLPSALTEVYSELHLLLRTFEAYLDSEEIVASYGDGEEPDDPRWRLDPATDAEMVDGYRRLLACVLTPELVESRVAELEAAFERHRGRFVER